jgi:ribosomal protein L9
MAKAAHEARSEADARSLSQLEAARQRLSGELDAERAAKEQLQTALEEQVCGIATISSYGWYLPCE